MSEQCMALEELQSAWLDGVLDTLDWAQMGTHLDWCAPCQAQVQALARTRTLLRSLPVRQVPAGLFASEPSPGEGGRRRAGIGRGEGGRASGRRRAGIGRGEGGRAAGVPRRVAGRTAAAAAVLAGLLGGAAFGLGGQPEPASRLVQVPIDVYAVDHLVRTVGGPLSTPVFIRTLRR